MISKPQISSSQLCVMLVVSRLFSIFTYKPQSYEIGAITSAVCIAASLLISFLIFLPTFILVGKKNDTSVSDIGYFYSGKLAGIFSFGVVLICLFLCVECLTQFTFFMSSTLYLSSTPIFFLLPMTIVVTLITKKGIETIARLSGMVFAGMAFSLILIAVLSLSHIETVNIQPIKYDNFSQAVLFTFDNVAHTTEIIPFMIFCGNARGSIKKSYSLFLLFSGIFLEIVSFVTIGALGEYRNTIVFPFYTLSAMSENSLTDRMSLAFIVLWVFMAIIKLCLYFFVAVRSVNRLMQTNKSLVSTLICAAFIFTFSIYTCQNVISIEVMYKITLTCIPIIVLAVILPIMFFIKQKSRREEKSSE